MMVTKTIHELTHPVILTRVALFPPSFMSDKHLHGLSLSLPPPCLDASHHVSTNSLFSTRIPPTSPLYHPKSPFFPCLGVLQLNGVPTPMPLELPGSLTITETHTTLRISRIPGFLVELGAAGVTVEVPREARATLCGLCGDYDGATSNDLRGPDGMVTSDARALAEAWRAPDFTQVGDTEGGVLGGFGCLGGGTRGNSAKIGGEIA